MPIGGRIVYHGPRYGATRFTLRGTVTKHSKHVTGMWFWKRTFDQLTVTFNDAQLALAREKYGDVVDCNGGQDQLPRQVPVYLLPDRPLAEFPIGTEVAVTFAKGGQLEQWFQGREPLAIMDVAKTADVPRPALEITPVQPQLI